MSDEDKREDSSINKIRRRHLGKDRGRARYPQSTFGSQNC